MGIFQVMSPTQVMYHNGDTAMYHHGDMEISTPTSVAPCATILGKPQRSSIRAVPNGGSTHVTFGKVSQTFGSCRHVYGGAQMLSDMFGCFQQWSGTSSHFQRFQDAVGFRHLLLSTVSRCIQTSIEMFLLFFPDLVNGVLKTFIVSSNEILRVIPVRYLTM